MLNSSRNDFAIILKLNFLEIKLKYELYCSRWKHSSIFLKLTFKEILHKDFWVSWRVIFKGLGSKWRLDALVIKTMV